jgi:hypothetical protein
MDIQRLRNLTTGRLHTKMDDIYQDIEWLVGESGIMTHMLPRAVRALEPFLKEQCPDEKFWLDEYDTTHTGTIDINPLSAEQRGEFRRAYGALPNPLEGKTVIPVMVPDAA